MSTKLAKARKELINLSPDFTSLINKLDLKSINDIKNLYKPLEPKQKPKSKITTDDSFDI